jgi:hypothetical protein
MPENPVYSRDDGHFIYLATVELGLQDACLIAKNIFLGIRGIHSRSVIHRDLKPSNIIVTNLNLDVKILDFGISKLIDASTLTTTGQGMGTFAYMAPEQLKSAKDIDERADYYSIGAILYEMISYERPLRMSNQLEAIRKILEEIPEPLAMKVSNVPIEISELVETLLKKEPYQRSIPFETIINILDKYRRPISKNIPKITTVYFSSNIEFLPMTINNDSKAVLEYHRSHQIKGAVFNGPQLMFSDKNYLELSTNQNSVRLLIDPYTHTLAYSAFTTKPTYKKLPYIVSSLKKETPKDFINIASLQKRVQNVMDFQIHYDANILISPYHLLETENDGWVNIDYNAYKESKAYLKSKGINKPLYYGISLDIEKFEDTDSIKDLVNLVTSANPDGFYLQIAGSFDTTNSNHYYSYAYLVKLLAESKKEIILTRINDFSLGLIALGANTIATGVGQSDNFRKEFLNREENGSAPRRYYIEKLLGLYNKNILEDILSTVTGKNCICQCDFCKGSINTDHLCEFNNVIKHHIYTKNKQMNQLSSLTPEDRLKQFLERIEVAIQLVKDINREKKIKNFGYSHFEVWRDVILEVSKSRISNASHL